MANELILVRNQKNTASDTIEIFYTADNGIDGVLISAFTASNDNDGGSSISFKAYIYDSSGAAVSAVIPFSIVKRQRVNYGASIVGHMIPAGGSLRLESSQPDILSFYVTGQVLGT